MPDDLRKLAEAAAEVYERGNLRPDATEMRYLAAVEDPQAVLALLNGLDGYKRAFEESESDLQKTVRELRATEAERGRLRDALAWLYETVSRSGVSVSDSGYAAVTNAATVLAATDAARKRALGEA